MVLPEQYYYQGSSTDGVIISKKKHKLIICKHDGGSSYLMGLVTNGSFVSILGNGNDFSVTVKNREITVNLKRSHCAILVCVTYMINFTHASI